VLFRVDGDGFVWRKFSCTSGAVLFRETACDELWVNVDAQQLFQQFWWGKIGAIIEHEYVPEVYLLSCRADQILEEVRYAYETGGLNPGRCYTFVAGRIR